MRQRWNSSTPKIKYKIKTQKKLNQSKMKMQASLARIISMSAFEKLFWVINTFEKLKKMILHKTRHVMMPTMKKLSRNRKNKSEQKKLYEYPVGNQVDGLPPVSSLKSIFGRRLKFVSSENETAPYRIENPVDWCPKMWERNSGFFCNVAFMFRNKKEMWIWNFSKNLNYLCNIILSSRKEIHNSSARKFASNVSCLNARDRRWCM